MVSKWNLVVAIVGLSGGALTVDAQQNLPRPIVLYRPSATTSPPLRGPATFTTSSFATNPATQNGVAPNASRPDSSVAGSPNTGSANRPGQDPSGQTGAASQNGQVGNQPENQQKTPEQEWADQQSRPTNQMLQNPSGAANMTHSGMSSSQQMAPNTYFGQKFQTWSNQQAVGQMSSTFGETNRFQPGAFGGYVAPNTYVGAGFSSWSNLSQGGISSGATGSWSFSVWP